MDNKNKLIIAKNLAFYMSQKGVDRYKLCEDLNFKYSTVSEWLSANKYPRMDKIEILANYFNINKSDLIEEHTSTVIEEAPCAKLSENEKEMKDLFRKLTPTQQGKLIERARIMSEDNETETITKENAS